MTTLHPSPGQAARVLPDSIPDLSRPGKPAASSASNPGGRPSTELSPESTAWPAAFFAASSSSVKKLSARRQADSGTIVIHGARGRAATLGSPSEPGPSTAASEGLSCSAGAGLGTPFCRSAADGRPATEPSGSSTLCATRPPNPRVRFVIPWPPPDRPAREPRRPAPARVEPLGSCGCFPPPIHAPPPVPRRACFPRPAAG